MRYRSSNKEPYSLLEHARNYVVAMPPSISGQGGHNQTFRVACVLVQGFGLSTEDAWNLLKEYNDRCQPPWSDEELWHKIEGAENANPPAEGKGSMAKGVISPHTQKRYTPVSKEHQFEAFLKACFEPEDILSLAPGIVPDGEAKAIPEHGGVNLFTRDEWVKRVKEKGSISKIFSSRDGLFVRVNPIRLKSNGADKDVTAYRHVLVESDTVSKEEQERVLRESGLPISALIDSGANSIHAWVKVDAESKEQYHERREKVWKHLEGFEIDSANKNPSRYSRCPGGLRGAGTQNLLAVNLGPATYAEWEHDNNIDATLFDIEKLIGYDVGNDPNNLVGKRWLCRCAQLVIYGESGIGKSSLIIQLCLQFVRGESFFGIEPVRPLRVMIVQSENDIGDMAEELQGVKQGLSISAEEFKSLKERLFIYRCNTHKGQRFTSWLKSRALQHQPDLICVDPYMEFMEGEMISQKDVSTFNHQIQEMLNEVGAAIIFMHHTGKPKSSKDSPDGYDSGNYGGFGSSVLTNWARAIGSLRQISDNTFHLHLSKRGKRAGMQSPTGQTTQKITLKHSDQGIFWEQTEDAVKTKNGSVRIVKTDTYKALFSDMPPLKHNKDPEKSQVIAHIMSVYDEKKDTQLSVDEALKKFDSIRHTGRKEGNPVIIFDKQTRVWKGVSYESK